MVFFWRSCNQTAESDGRIRRRRRDGEPSAGALHRLHCNQCTIVRPGRRAGMLMGCESSSFSQMNSGRSRRTLWPQPIRAPSTVQGLQLHNEPRYKGQSSEENRAGVSRTSRRTDSTSPRKYDGRFGFISHQWMRKRKGEKKKEDNVCRGAELGLCDC